MAPSRLTRSRSRGAFIAVVIAGTLAALAIVHTQTPASESGDRTQGANESSSSVEAIPSDPARKTESGLRLHHDAKSGVTVHVPKGSYVSRPNPGNKLYTEPEPVLDGTVHFAAVDRNPRTDGTAIIYVTDHRKRVTDLLIYGSARSNGHLTKLQWMMSNDGVELLWPNGGKSAWQVTRNGKMLTEQGNGHFFDDTRVEGPTRYAVRHVEHIELELGGQMTVVDSPVTYIVIMPPYQKQFIGSLIDDIGPQWSPGIKSSGEAAGVQLADEPLEAARFLEWNSFIPEHYVPAPTIPGIGFPLCDSGLFDYYGGDDRGFIDQPASEAYSARGTPRQRISTRVGASWDVMAGTNSVNSTRYDDWLYKSVGTTTAYNSSHELVAAKNAGTAGIRLIESSSNAERAWRLVRISVADPLCSILNIADAPTVDYTYSLDVVKAGTAVVSATFDQAPSHEILWEEAGNIADPDSFVGGCLYRFENRGLYFLSAQLPNERIQLEFPSEVPPGDCPIE